MRRIGEDSLFWKVMDASVADWIGFGAAFVALIVLVWLFVRIRAWLQDDAGPEANTHQMLTQFGDLHRQGDLSEEEYRSIKSQLIEKLEDSPREETEKPMN